MAKEAKKAKQAKVVVQDKDHPSLIEVGGKIRLRVLEDFYVERETPKWVRFREEWDKFKKVIGFSFSDFTDARELESRVKNLKDKSEEEKAVLLKQGTNLLAMDKAMQDDRWHIREKHEREVDEAILKQAKFVRQLTVWDKAKNALRPRSRRAIPVEVAMVDLLDHIELTSTPELSARMEKLKELEDGMRKAGQYKKADIVKQLRTIVAEESVVVASGFTNYVSEDTMIEFLRKSERGTMVDFLRYYDDEIPAEVIEKKVAADKLMVFDNYVVAHYSDLIHKAATVAEKVSAREEKKQREKRRDPILFGLIKNSRKLYYICDWKTDTDDLTLEKIEKELGVTRGSLVRGAETSTQASSLRTTGLDVDRDEVNTNLGSTYGQMRSFIANLDDFETQRRFYEWDGGRLSSTASGRML
jgi:hypothetical protein